AQTGLCWCDPPRIASQPPPPFRAGESLSGFRGARHGHERQETTCRDPGQRRLYGQGRARQYLRWNYLTRPNGPPEVASPGRLIRRSMGPGECLGSSALRWPGPGIDGTGRLPMRKLIVTGLGIAALALSDLTRPRGPSRGPERLDVR